MPQDISGKASIERLLEIMVRLRDRERGCPWDVEQTFATIAPYTIEEAYEVVDAIDRNDMPALKDELGDLLLQVVFHARMAEEQGAFAFDDVVAAIADKMTRRHPHVFAGATVADAAAQTVAWDEQKRRERVASGDADDSALSGIARGMPEWQRATKLQSRAAKIGFDWPGPAPVI
ncbi:MAG: nucleoside triphosphate pyrophosphohydrolase, partial [Luteimonas sp.]